MVSPTGSSGFPPVRITLVNSTLAMGGTERVLTTMANFWASRGWTISIVTLDDHAPFFPLADGVTHLPLGLAGPSEHLKAKIANSFLRLRALRRAMQSLAPDLVISFQAGTNVDVLLATRGLHFPVVVSERCDPAVAVTNFTRRSARDVVYPWAARLIVQSARALDDLSPRLKGRAEVIPNPVLAGSCESTNPAPPIRRPSIVALGRLIHEKGYDLLLHAMALLGDRYPRWSLSIAGDGPLKHQLQQQAARLGLGNHVTFLGKVAHPHAVLCQTDVFVLPSRSEGFPNALCEAMACGLPVVATDCRLAPREIIRHGVDGLLVEPENPQALADGIQRLMSNEPLRARLAERAPEVLERFSLEKVMLRWDWVVHSAIKDRSGARCLRAA